MNDELTDEAIEEGRIAILNLEKELKERANDTVSTGSNKHHSSTTDERRILDQMPREARLNNRLESLGLTVEELDDRGLLDGGGSVPSYVTSLKNKSRRTLELQSRSHRLQGRDKETFTKLLNSFLHMIRTLVRKGLNLDVYCRRHDPNRRGLMRKKAFFTMLKSIGLPFTGRELQDITLHYMVPASDQADYVSLLKDARIVNLGAIANAAYDQERSQLLPDDTVDETAKSVTEPDTGISSPSHEPVRGDMELSVHTLVLADVRRMLLESIRSLSKDQDDVYRMFARWDTNGTGTVTATQFLRVLARLHVDISDQDQDFLVELLDTNGMGRIDFEGLIAFCFASTPETDILSPVGLLSGGGSLSVGEDNVNNETMSAVSTEGNTSVDKSYNNGSSGGINSRRPHTATLSRPYNESMSHAHSTAHTSNNAPHPYAPQTQTYYHHHSMTLEEQHQRGGNSSRTNARGIQRPLTASGRVSSTQDHTLSPSNTAQGALGGRYFPDHGGLGDDKHIKTQSLVMEYGHSDRAGNMRSDAQPAPKNKISNNPVPRAPQSSQPNKNLSMPKPQGQRGPEGEDSQYVVELPDDVMYGEEKYLGSDSARVRPAGYNVAVSKAAPKEESRAPPQNVYSQHPHAQHASRGNTNHGTNTVISNHYFNPAQPRGDSPSMEMQELHEMGSFNDNTLVTDQEEYFFGSPKEIPTLNNTRNLMNSMNSMNNNMNLGNNVHNWASQAQSDNNNTNNNNGDYSRNNRDYSNNGNFTRIWREPDTSMMSKSNSNSNMNNNNNHNSNHNQGQYVQYDTNNYNNSAQQHPAHNSHNPHSSTQNTPYHAPAPAAAEPIEHLVLLATQILSTLREIIMGRYRRGRSLQEIYEHFDRSEKTFFDAADFVTATADLRIETSARVASIAINMIALDGYDKVSFGEFKVFVLDSDHKLLELNVQEQLAQMLEQKGREYQSFMADMFWNEEESLNDSRVSATGRAYRQSEFVSKLAFVSSLQRIGLVLTSSELSRLVDRFDVHGNEMCSVPRFVRMVQNSRAWRHGEKVLAYQDEALEEGDFLRRHLQNSANGGNGSGNPHEMSLPDLPEELISMCEYLGIRALSEPNMVWIAADALKAPLPVSWTAQKDANGRTYFYNHLNNQTKLEHPLDPHFRKLRDKYRQGGSNDADLDSSGGRNTSTLPNGSHHNTTNTAAKNANSAISFGGLGAALNPPPLNQSLVGQARPQPPPNSFQHLYTHANGEHHFPVIGTSNNNHNQNNQNLSPSMQMLQDEDEVLYVKYGNMGNNSNPQTAKSSPGTGYGQQPPQSNNINVPRAAGSRRPQSALDRTQFSAQQQQAPRGRDAAQPSTAGAAQSTLPSGISTGIYSAELKALMGSAAYNRPVSAPQNHHVQAEKLNAYTDASNRMRDNTKEEHKKNTMELLEAVYTNYPKPLPRASSSGNAPNNSNANTNYANMNSTGNSGGDGKFAPSGMGSRSGSAKWANQAPANTNSTPLSVVDRAMSIGRSSTSAYQPSRAEQQVYANYNNPNNQYQSQGNPHAGHSGGQQRERSRSANRAAHRVPLDSHTKQARLSEMYDEAILDKLDSAIGIRR